MVLLKKKDLLLPPSLPLLLWAWALARSGGRPASLS